MADRMREKVARAIRECESWSSFWDEKESLVLSRAALDACHFEELVEAVTALVRHDEADDRREGLDPCVELQTVCDVLAKVEAGDG